MKNLLLRCLAATACSAAVLASAQTAYPTKPITIVVGYPPGGSTDLMARTLGTELSTRLGVPVVIDNVGGAGGSIGAQKVVRAAPDGYTLLVGANNEIAISRLVSASVKYETKDFTPLGLIASQPMLLVASAKSGVKNLDQFMAQVKANPGKFSYGSSGVGTGLHLAGEMVKDQGGLFLTHIPYRGVAPLVNDLLGSNIEFGVCSCCPAACPMSRTARWWHWAPPSKSAPPSHRRSRRWPRTPNSRASTSAPGLR